MQLLRQYYISYDSWDMTGDVHGPSTPVMETVLKYLRCRPVINTVTGPSASS